MSSFRNPSNNYEEKISLAFLWCLLFGCFYLAYKGAWIAAIVSFAAAFITFGLAWLIIPFFAHSLVRRSYLQRGWIEVGG